MRFEIELENEVRKSKFMEKKFAGEDKIAELAAARQIRLHEPLNIARESLAQALGVAKQRQLDADYCERRGVDLEVKAAQAIRAQLAMQAPLEEAQQNQKLILGEFDGMERKVREASVEDFESAASGSGQRLNALEKSPSKIAARLGALLAKKWSASDEQATEGWANAGASTDPASSKMPSTCRFKQESAEREGLPSSRAEICLTTASAKEWQKAHAGWAPEASCAAQSAADGSISAVLPRRARLRPARRACSTT